MKKYFFLFLFFPVFLPAQDPVLSKYNSMPLELNPAFAGTNGRGRLSMGYRDQWPAIDRGYRTTLLSYDHYIEKFKSGIGIKYSHDGGPELLTNTNTIYGVYSYHLVLQEKILIQPALEFGLINEKLDTSKIITTSPETFKASVGAFDCGAGILMAMQRFDLGFAVHHLNQPDLSFVGASSKLHMRLTLHGSILIGSASQEFEKKISVIPQFMGTRQGDFRQLNAGVSVKYAHWQFGVAFRSDDAVIGMLGYQNNHFRVSYSYDYTISSLTNARSGGAHEFSLQLFMFTRHQDGLGLTDVTTYAF